MVSMNVFRTAYGTSSEPCDDVEIVGLLVCCATEDNPEVILESAVSSAEILTASGVPGAVETSSSGNVRRGGLLA